MAVSTDTIERGPIAGPLTECRYSADDAESDAGHLAHLLDVAFDTLLSVDFGTTPVNRHALERLNALLWIARDCAEKVRDGLANVPRDYLPPVIEGRAA